MNKKNVLVIGGNGTIGKELVKELDNREYQTYIIDKQNFDQLPETKFLGYNCYGIENVLRENDIGVVVNLGENLRADNVYDAQLINDNVTEYMHVLSVCAKTGVALKCCVWDMRHYYDIHHYTNPLIYSMESRPKAISMYNKGNAAITKISFEHVINFDYPASNWFSIMNRILNSFLYNNSVIVKDNEYLNCIVGFTTTEKVVRTIIKDVDVRNRDGIYDIPESYCHHKLAIETFMDILGIEKLSIEINKNLVKFSRGDAKKYPTLTNIFEKEIDRLNEYYRRTREESESATSSGMADGGTVSTPV